MVDWLVGPWNGHGLPSSASAINRHAPHGGPEPLRSLQENQHNIQGHFRDFKWHAGFWLVRVFIAPDSCRSTAIVLHDQTVVIDIDGDPTTDIHFNLIKESGGDLALFDG